MELNIEILGVVIPVLCTIYIGVMCINDKRQEDIGLGEIKKGTGQILKKLENIYENLSETLKISERIAK